MGHTVGWEDKSKVSKLVTYWSGGWHKLEHIDHGNIESTSGKVDEQGANLGIDVILEDK